jgi:hypothetical protein
MAYTGQAPMSRATAFAMAAFVLAPLRLLPR